MTDKTIQAAFDRASDTFAATGVDVAAALAQVDEVPISLHCWQGDDVRGFENPDAVLTGGIQVSGNYPGRARSPQELRADLDLAMSLIPGKLRLNLHASYLETAEKVERDAIEPKHFHTWVDWAKAKGIGLDFNPTLFSHPLAADNRTLSHPDAGIRRFWIDHCKASRKVSESFGRSLGTPSVMNIWIPDGSKDLPADRFTPRNRLRDALDDILSEPISKSFHKDAVEGKLFGIGAEAYTVGSNEFYLAYAAKRGTMLCLDAGHFHPTEVVSDKLSAVLSLIDEVLLHVSRPMRWDSDHVVLLDDETQAIASELVRGNVLGRVAIGLDFFDASINRIAAWVVGTRNMRKALLRAMLEPRARLVEAEARDDATLRMALFEEHKSSPWGAVWDYYCSSRNAPVGLSWFDAVKTYEHDVLAKR
ncbi:MAG: L-rhamnose isomerase [Ancalomicrobiaceae bacterium]|nr:L-rhamnose isomerase [Ancalomicrobiaceae bacterium]